MVFHFPPISGGGVVVVVGIANTLVELGHDVTVITPDLEWTGKKYDPKINPKLTVVRVDTPSRSNLKIAARRCQNNIKKKGVELGRQKKYDFVFSIFHPFHLVSRAAVSCGKELGIPVIIKIDDAIYEKSSGIKSIQRRLEKMYNSKTLKSATRVLVSNQDTKELVSAFYKVSKEKIAIVPNGVDLSYFQTKSVKAKKVVFSGAMYYHRGIDVLLDAAPKIAKKILGVEFLLLGDGPEMQKLQKIVNEKNLSSNVQFKGWIEREKIPEHLSDSSIGIGPLRSTDVTRNALPIKVLEYMASSLPIVAAEGTLPQDLLKDGYNGYFIKNSSDLARRVISLLEDEKTRLKMGEKSKEMVSKFDWKNVGGLILEEYQKIIQ